MADNPEQCWKIPKSQASIDKILEAAGYKVSFESSEADVIQLGRWTIGKKYKIPNHPYVVKYQMADPLQMEHSVALAELLRLNDVPFREEPPREQVAARFRELADKLTQASPATVAVPHTKKVPMQGNQNLLERRLREDYLGVRVLNCYLRLGLETYGDLVKKNARELMCVPGFGARSLAQIEKKLAELGLHLASEQSLRSIDDAILPEELGVLCQNPRDDYSYSPKALHAFKVLGVNSYGTLVQKTEEDLLNVKSFGKKTLDEVKTRLERIGLSLEARGLAPASSQHDVKSDFLFKSYSQGGYRWDPVARKVMGDMGITTVYDFAKYTMNEIKAIPGIDDRAFKHIEIRMGDKGISFSGLSTD